jgi:4-oxalocrotonate tautomerase
MPHVIVKMYPGRSEQQKARLAEAIVKDVMAITNVGDAAVSVTIEEVEPDDWAEKMYKPDSRERRRQTLQEAGINPLR